MSKTSLVLILLLVLFTAQSKAHPHSWISLKSEFELDTEGRLTSLTQHWEFDVYYSMMAIADMMNNYGDQQKGLKLLAKDMAKNLKSYQYFSSLKIDNRALDLPEPSETMLNIVEKDEQQILKLSMQFKWSLPRPIENKSVSLQVFDPTYYIDMRHYDASQITIRSLNASECETTVQLPDPSDEMIEYALNLDRTQKDTQGLGENFAEQVLIHCH